MAFTQMRFDKVWTNPVDFPTHETQESKVREDMQYLFDSIKNQFNNFLSNELTSANLFFARTTDIDCDNVQDAIEYVFSQIQEAYSGSIPDGAVSTAKLTDEAVTTAKLADNAVTEDKIADGAVTGDKIAAGAVSGTSFADGSIPAGKLDINSVGTDNLVNNCVTDVKLANDAVITQRIKDGAVTTAKILDANVTTAKIANANVTTAKIKDGNVTEAKLASALSTKINGKQDQHKEVTVTLSANASSWNNVAATGVTATNLVFASPNEESDDYFVQWTNHGVRMYSQGAGTVSFKANSNITAAIKVNLAIFD